MPMLDRKAEMLARRLPELESPQRPQWFKCDRMQDPSLPRRLQRLPHTRSAVLRGRWSWLEAPWVPHLCLQCMLCGAGGLAPITGLWRSCRDAASNVLIGFPAPQLSLGPNPPPRDRRPQRSVPIAAGDPPPTPPCAQPVWQADRGLVVLHWPAVTRLGSSCRCCFSKPILVGVT